MRNTFSKAFTLIELLVVITIIAILAALAGSAFNRVRNKPSTNPDERPQVYDREVQNVIEQIGTPQSTH